MNAFVAFAAPNVSAILRTVIARPKVASFGVSGIYDFESHLEISFDVTAEAGVIYFMARFNISNALIISRFNRISTSRLVHPG